MYVRLAFSTAIHVDPEILIVDEALAFGDAVFANRCSEIRNCARQNHRPVRLTRFPSGEGALQPPSSF